MSKANTVAEANVKQSVLNQERMIEAILFAVKEPITIDEIKSRIPDVENIKEILQSLKKKYQTRGVNVVRVGSGWLLERLKTWVF